MKTITTSVSASTNFILAMDLGKYKSVACAHDEATGEIPARRIGSRAMLMTREATYKLSSGLFGRILQGLSRRR